MATVSHAFGMAVTFTAYHRFEYVFIPAEHFIINNTQCIISNCSIKYCRLNCWCCDLIGVIEVRTGTKQLQEHDEKKELFHLCREFALYTDTPVLEVDLNLQLMLNSPEH